MITSGIAYQYAKEALGDTVSYLKLGMVNPLPVHLIQEFASKVEKVYVIEELDPVIEHFCRQNGIEVIGKVSVPDLREFSQTLIAKLMLGKEPEKITLDQKIPMRPPAMCCGCPHRGIFYTLKKRRCLSAVTLAATPWARLRR